MAKSTFKFFMNPLVPWSHLKENLLLILSRRKINRHQVALLATKKFPISKREVYRILGGETEFPSYNNVLYIVWASVYLAKGKSLLITGKV